jgi:hypothetical protein
MDTAADTSTLTVSVGASSTPATARVTVVNAENTGSTTAPVTAVSTPLVSVDRMAVTAPGNAPGLERFISRLFCSASTRVPTLRPVVVALLG